MKHMMQYRGCYGSVHYSDEDRVFYGGVEFIRALISCEGTDVQSHRQRFEDALDDFLETCKEKGVAVEKPHG
jgi:predicted HicB family RNase H-like nuclease